MTRLIQVKKGSFRRVALVEEPEVRLLDSCSSIFELAHIAIETGIRLIDVARKGARHEAIEYNPIYLWRERQGKRRCGHGQSP